MHVLRVHSVRAEKIGVKKAKAGSGSRPAAILELDIVGVVAAAKG
jgi:hypothetical protein